MGEVEILQRIYTTTLTRLCNFMNRGPIAGLVVEGLDLEPTADSPLGTTGDRMVG